MLQKNQLKNFNISWHVFVAVCGLVFGIVFILLTPPFQSNDENIHFFSVNNFSRGDFSNKIPESLRDLSSMHGDFYFTPSKKYSWNLWKKAWSYRQGKEERNYTTLVEKRNIVAYIPLMITDRIVSLFTDRYLVKLYLERLTALCIYVLLAASAIKIAPLGKAPLALVALMPQTLFMSSMINCDFLSFGATLLFAAVYMRDVIISPVERVSFKSPLFIAALLISFTKFPYLLSAGMLLLVPRVVLRKSWYAIGLLCIIFLLHAGGQISVVNELNPVDYQPHHAEDLSAFRPLPETFVEYAVLFFSRLKNLLFSPMHIFFIGGSLIGFLGNFCTLLHPFFLIFYFLFCLSSLLVTENVQIKIESRFQNIFILHSCCMTGMLIGIFFLLGVRRDHTIIEGLQGRYFIPAVIFLFLGMFNRIQYFPLKQMSLFERIAKIMILVMLIAAAYTIYQRFYTKSYFFDFYR